MDKWGLGALSKPSDSTPPSSLASKLNPFLPSASSASLILYSFYYPPIQITLDLSSAVRKDSTPPCSSSFHKHRLSSVPFTCPRPPPYYSLSTVSLLFLHLPSFIFIPLPSFIFILLEPILISTDGFWWEPFQLFPLP